MNLVKELESISIPFFSSNLNLRQMRETHSNAKNEPNLFLSRRSIKHVQYFNISWHIVLFHKLRHTKFRQRNESWQKTSKSIRMRIEINGSWNLEDDEKHEGIREPEVDQRWLRASPRDRDLMWMMNRVSPLSTKFSIAQFRPSLLLFEKSIATPIVLSFPILSLLSSWISWATLWSESFGDEISSCLGINVDACKICCVRKFYLLEIWSGWASRFCNRIRVGCWILCKKGIIQR